MAHASQACKAVAPPRVCRRHGEGDLQRRPTWEVRVMRRLVKASVEAAFCSMYSRMLSTPTCEVGHASCL